MSPALGLQRLIEEPPVLIVGPAASTVLVIVCAQVAVLPQASIARYLRVVVSVQPTSSIASLTCVTVGVLQASVAVTVAGFGAGTFALHPRFNGAAQLIEGAVTSAVHVAVRDAEEVFPQLSRAIQVLVCERPQPLLLTLPSLWLRVGVLQPSEAEAVPSAAPISLADGLHPRAGPVPPVVIAGPLTSTDQLIV